VTVTTDLSPSFHPAMRRVLGSATNNVRSRG
jgi:hypothetical protein